MRGEQAQGQSPDPAPRFEWEFWTALACVVAGLSYEIWVISQIVRAVPAS